MNNTQNIQDNTIIEKAWQAFHKKEDYDYSILRPEIYDSWIRSQQYGVDSIKAIPAILPKDKFNQLLKDNFIMRQTALPFMRQIFEIINNSGCAVILSNKDCILLESISDDSISSYTDKTHSSASLAPGSIQNESTIGTTEIALCLRYKQPMMVSGSEFYAEYNKKLSCLGAPLFDEHNNIIGVLSVSMGLNNFHKHSYGMIISLAEAITNEIKLKSSHQRLASISALLQSTLETVPQGLLVINGNGIIIQLNSLAEHMLNYHKNELHNKSIDQFISGSNGYVKFSEISSELDQEMLVDTNSGAKRFFVTVKFFSEPGTNKSQFKLITFRETKTVSTFTNKIAAFQAKYNFCDILGKSEQIYDVIQVAKLAAKSPSTILITGESGTGKELFAQAIHNNSKRANGPFVSLNCGALPSNLIESELFGYDTGAFTGARKGGQLGKFELAHQGTLFLDEIGDMPLAVQVSILRVLQTHEVTRLGGTNPISLDVRIIAATNKNLLEEVRNKKFREDLYYRLNVIHLHIPPLRERKEDIVDLSTHFLKTFERQQGTPLELPDNVYHIMQEYNWPGNIRELENFIERIVNTSMVPTSDSQIIVGNARQILLSQTNNCTIQNNKVNIVPCLHEFDSADILSLKEIEDAKVAAETRLICKILKEVDGNISKCAVKLGLTRRTLYRKMDEYEIDYQNIRNI